MDDEKTCTGADADAGDFNLRGRFRPRLRGDSRRRVSEHGRQEKNKEKKGRETAEPNGSPLDTGSGSFTERTLRQRSAQDLRLRSHARSQQGTIHQACRGGLCNRRWSRTRAVPLNNLGTFTPGRFDGRLPPLPGGRSPPLVRTSPPSCTTRASRLHTCHRQRGPIPLHLPASCARYGRPLSHIRRAIIFDDDTRLDAGYDTASHSLRPPLPTTACGMYTACSVYTPLPRGSTVRRR
jgi:hypothetical protein